MTLSREEMQQIILDVRANQAKLDGCRRHVFEDTGKRRIGALYQCRNCGGEANSEKVHWYEMGLKHSAEATE